MRTHKNMEFTGVTTRTRTVHVFGKYPELLNIPADRETYETAIVKNDRLKRNVTERIQKCRKSKKLSTVILRQFKRTIADMTKNNNNLLFTCPICRNILNVPVTVKCGHTFCRDCLVYMKNQKCFVCENNIGSPECVNVLIQHVAEKWRELINNDLLSKADEILNSNLPYFLRSTCAAFENRTEFSQNKAKKILRTLILEERRRRSCDCVADIITTSSSTLERILSRRHDYVVASDLECILCSCCLMDPITTTCGHTFCRDCLARVLDHHLPCPLCMAPLKVSEQHRGTTVVLEQALWVLFPEEYRERLVQCSEKEVQIPIFVCTNAFPGVACPLYVYEPRYRLLTRRSLESKRKRFGMVAKSDTREKFASYGTLLEVKDALYLKHGTSILTTVGTRRFKIIDRGEKDGYDTAAVQYIRDNKVSNEKLPELITLHRRVYEKASSWVKSLGLHILAEIERSIGQMPQLEKNWISLPDGPAWAWWLMPILPLRPQLQVGFLSSTRLENRLLAIEKMLEILQMKASERRDCSCKFSEDTAVDIPLNSQ